MLTDHGMQVLIFSNCCPTCARSILGCLGLLRPVSAAGVAARRAECHVRQVGRNVHAGSCSPAIKEVNAGQGRYLLIGSGLLQDSTAARMIQA